MPTEEQAFQFAVILSAGLPATEAIRYFAVSDDPQEVSAQLHKWLRSKLVRQAQVKLMGKTWQEMTLEERMRKGLDQHYAGLAWYLYNQHYAEADSVAKGKLDSARTALEAKLAGTAGKGDALSRFFDDINSGKVKLSRQVLPGSGGQLPS